MAKVRNLEDLLVHELKDLYDAEQQLVEALPLLAQAVTSEDLKGALEAHLEQTRGHVERLSQVFKALGKRATRETCEAMQGLVTEAQQVLEEGMEPNVLDAAIIAAAQKVEHYEMASYGTARTFAHMLGQHEAAQLLQETLDEEEQTDKNLSKLANTLNMQAVAVENQDGRKSGSKRSR
ncbi:MAG: ferritin-like domain-containing protein [Anaerolineae bacterium]|nr:ferritin-like domain-containing protein [Anaerolineae bacterium]